MCSTLCGHTHKRCPPWPLHAHTTLPLLPSPPTPSSPPLTSPTAAAAPALSPICLPPAPPLDCLSLHLSSSSSFASSLDLFIRTFLRPVARNPDACVWVGLEERSQRKAFILEHGLLDPRRVDGMIRSQTNTSSSRGREQDRAEEAAERGGEREGGGEREMGGE
ncbi:unnamed protein product [Closterium sp. Naga37s-1]|nr:unnamed protein product [Closterium sp. Naga37s-1]